MPMFCASGRTSVSKLRKCASMTFSGICTVSNLETIFAGEFEHVQMNVRVLVTREADVLRLARFASLRQSLHGTAGGEEPVRVVKANRLVKLQQIDVIGLKPSQRFIDLFRGLFLRPPVELRHDEGFLTIAVLERLSRAGSHSAPCGNPRSCP